MTHQRRQHSNQKRGLELSNIVPTRFRVLRKQVYIKKVSKDYILQEYIRYIHVSNIV